MLRRLRLSLLLTIALQLAACSAVRQVAPGLGLQQEPTPSFDAPVAPTVVATATYTVDRGDITQVLEFAGTVVAADEQGLYFRAGGRVRNVFVQPYETVKAGQLLADLENGELENDLALARLDLKRGQDRLADANEDRAANIKKAEISLAIAQLGLERMVHPAPESPTQDRTLMLQQQKQVELAQLALDQASKEIDPGYQYEVDRAQIQITRVEARIAAANLKAPFDGQIISIRVSPGLAVEAYKPVASIADPSLPEVKANLTESQMQGLHEGMPATVKPSEGRSLSAHLTSLPLPYGKGADRQDGSVRITPDAGQATLKFGNEVQVTITVQQKTNVLWLPPAAVQQAEGQYFVTVQEGTTRRRISVLVGLITNDRIEIEDGLTKDQVVLGQ